MATTAPWLEDRKLTRISASKDPRDKSTIFSIFPKAISEYKVTLFPPKYDIPAGTLAKPSSLVIGSASWFKDIPESNQLVEVVHNSMEVAESVIRDYNIGYLGWSPHSQPGLFFVPEEITVADALKKFPEMFKEADEKQRAWYLKLVDLADQIWSKTPNPAAIGSDMRLAANELGLENKDWLKNYTAAAMSKCPACGALRDTNFPICGSCKIVADPEKFAKLNLRFAENK